jgi:hypothetical protein
MLPPRTAAYKMPVPLICKLLITKELVALTGIERVSVRSGSVELVLSHTKYAQLVSSVGANRRYGVPTWSPSGLPRGFSQPQRTQGGTVARKRTLQNENSIGRSAASGCGALNGERNFPEYQTTLYKRHSPLHASRWDFAIELGLAPQALSRLLLPSSVAIRHRQRLDR